MIEIFDRSKSRPVPCGLVSTLKTLDIGESIIVPEAKKSSIHPAAKRAGIRVTLRTLGDGTICAWRVPLKGERPPVAVDIGSAIAKPAAQDPQPFPGPADTPKPKLKPKRPGYHQVDQWSPRVWVDDLDAITVTKGTIFS